MIRRVFIAVDESPRAPKVLARGLELAHAAGAAVRVYHAVTLPPEIPPAAVTQGGDALPAHLHRQATERLGKLLALAEAAEHGTASPPTPRPELVVEESLRTWRTILEAADRYDADLVVIGSHGYDLVDRLLGTTAAKVVNGSTRDVLVVR